MNAKPAHGMSEMKDQRVPFLYASRTNDCSSGGSALIPCNDVIDEPVPCDKIFASEGESTPELMRDVI